MRCLMKLPCLPVPRSFYFGVCLAALTGCTFMEQKKPATPPTHPSLHVPLSQNQDIRLCLDSDPGTLDPRKVRGLHGVNVVNNLFEGLTRIDAMGMVKPAATKKVTVSNNMKTYTFTLDESKWSNGQPVTANDFVNSWKSTLDPETRSPHAYQLFLIKNGKAAFEGKAAPEDIGVRAADDQTLIVTLEHPAPYFLELVASYPFFPVCANQEDSLVSNGPFCLVSWKPNVEIELEPNPYYPQAADILVKKVSFQIVDDRTELALFERGKLDWAGSPTSTIPMDAIASLKKRGMINTLPAAGTGFVRANCGVFPLSCAKLRKALALAIDTQAIVDHIMQGNQPVATAFVPPCLGLTNKGYFTPHDTALASKLFEDALGELKVSRETLPQIRLTYASSSDRSQKIAQAIQQDWKTLFQIEVALEPQEQKLFFENVFTKQYQLALGSWFADFYDPISFLSIFQYKENGTNNTDWDNSDYARLLQESTFEMDRPKRFALLEEAQEILMQDMPVFPLFYYTFSFLKNPLLEGVWLNELGILELKHSYMAALPPVPSNVPKPTE